MDSTFLDRLIAAAPPAGNTATVLAYLSTNYPAKVLGWVTTPGIAWTRKTVPLADVQYARRVGGARDDDKTQAIQKKIEAGVAMQPVVLIDPGAGGKLVVADGYHRTLAFDRANKKTIEAWVAVGARGFDAVAMHSAKKNTGPVKATADSVLSQIDGPGDVSPIDHGTPIPSGPFGERYPTATITVNGANGSKAMSVGRAITPAQRALGLSNLPDAGYDSALLMSWPYDQSLATLSNNGVSIPVHASFYDSTGRHTGSLSMDADDRTPKTAPAPHQHCLELHQDAADALGIGPGSSISLPEEEDQTRNGSVGFGGPRG